MKNYPKLKFQLLSENAVVPERGTNGSSGIDVFSTIDCVVEARCDIKIPLDIRFEIPYGWDLTVNNKSGVATKKKLCKGAELIDSDYRGNVIIHLINHSENAAEIKKGEKISQLVMREIWMGELEMCEYISTNTKRGPGKFGSTGT